MRRCRGGGPRDARSPDIRGYDLERTVRVPRGGARNRGPIVRDPMSEASLARRRNAAVLPAGGYDGPVPRLPLPRATEREHQVWDEAWRTPQAAAWSVEPWRWRTVAMWVRWSVRAEDRDASAAVGNVVHRLADIIGLTPAGLGESGWRLADASDTPSSSGAVLRHRPRSRFPSTPGGDAS